MKFEFDLSGLEDIRKVFAQLPKKMGKKIIAGATKAGAKELEKELKRKAPIATGLTKKSIGTFRINVTDSTATYSAGPYKKVNAAFRTTNKRSRTTSGGRIAYSRKKRGSSQDTRRVKRFNVALWYELGRGGRTGPQRARPFIDAAFRASATRANSTLTKALIQGLVVQGNALSSAYGVTRAVKWSYKAGA